MYDIKECNSLKAVHVQSVALVKAATDLVNCDLVIEGYARSGQPACTPYLNLSSMATSRLKKLFPLADFKDPLYERLLAEAKYICAECIKTKYECRARRQPYNHLKDADLRVKALVERVFNDYKKYIETLPETVPCVGYISQSSGVTRKA